MLRRKPGACQDLGAVEAAQVAVTAVAEHRHDCVPRTERPCHLTQAASAKTHSTSVHCCPAQKQNLLHAYAYACYVLAWLAVPSMEVMMCSRGYMSKHISIQRRARAHDCKYARI